MLCAYILKRGKNKGKQCSVKGKTLFNAKWYCSRHYKMQQGIAKMILILLSMTVTFHLIVLMLSKKLAVGHLGKFS